MLVEQVVIESFLVERILMDNESAVDILMHSTYKVMDFDEALLRQAAPNYRFGNNPIRVKGIIPLQVYLGDRKHTASEQREFLIVDLSSTYISIFKRLLMKKMKIFGVVYCFTVKLSAPFE